jgi:hypothetical protein
MGDLDQGFPPKVWEEYGRMRERADALEAARDALLTGLDEYADRMDGWQSVDGLRELIARYRVGGSE